jgi:hypothetical protein
MNKTIANRQFKSINEIVQFINDQNYYGDNYQMHRQMQIDASKYWIRLFMPEDKNFNLILDYVRSSTTKIIDKVQQIMSTAKYT